MPNKQIYLISSENKQTKNSLGMMGMNESDCKWTHGFFPGVLETSSN